MKLAALCLITSMAFAGDPDFNKAGELVRPQNYREWIFLSSGLGMQYGNGNGDPFTNVFVEPSSYRKFVETGAWPEKTIFALEIRQPATEGSINKGGHYQADLIAVEFSVKDSTRFQDGWGYFGFSGNAQAAKVNGPQAGCNACHNANGAVEHTFVQFYPTLLEIARSKGTLKASFLKDAAKLR